MNKNFRLDNVLAVLDSGTDGDVLTFDSSTESHLDWGTGGSGGAPIDAEYVVVSTDPTLTDERVLTGTANRITITDGGAGNAITLDVGSGVTTLAFKTISVSGQSDVVADSSADTLTLVGGTGITITTNASTDTITLTGSATGAPVGAQYVTLATDGTLTSERVLTGTTNDITITDNGAGNTVVLDIGSNVVTLTGTQTLTNKRITKRPATITSAAAPAINTDTTDIFFITAQAVNITSFTTNLTGTPVNGDLLRIVLTATGAITVAWGTSFESSTVILPVTASTTRQDIGLVWNGVTSKWRCIVVV